MPEAMSTRIIPITDEYWPSTWAIMEPIIRAGETYPYATDMPRNGAHTKWIKNTRVAYVAINPANEVIGTYYIKPNQDPLGAHICNCGYITATHVRRQGIAKMMCEHSQREAKKLGFKAMQFNLVVSSNNAGFQLWKKMGFTLIGTVPEAFDHAKLGLVDAHIMHKKL